LAGGKTANVFYLTTNSTTLETAWWSEKRIAGAATGSTRGKKKAGETEGSETHVEGRVKPADQTNEQRKKPEERGECHKGRPLSLAQPPKVGGRQREDEKGLRAPERTIPRR